MQIGNSFDLFVGGKDARVGTGFEAPLHLWPSEPSAT